MGEKSRAYQKLKLSEFKLQTLLEITNSINENVATDKLFNLFRFILRNQLNIGKVIFYSKGDTGWECALKYGVRGKERLFNVDEDLLHIKDITVIESSSKEYLNSFDVVIPVYHKNTPLAYLLLGDIDEQEIRISSIIKHLNFIQTLANIIAVAIENKRMAKESIRQERIKRELEFASEMQSLLFPETLPDTDKIQVAALYQPHQQVGGDYYDYIPLNREEFAFCMADVSGKGISAALLMSNFQANLRAFIHYSRFSLSDLVKELNTRVMATAKGEKYITIFIGKYNITNRTLHYINAAHNPPLLLNNGELQELNLGCTGVGMFDEIPAIEEGEIVIPPNSVLTCYTDGIVEQENAEKEEFGIDRLGGIMQNHGAKAMKLLNERILKDVDRFRGDIPYVDDLTLFSARFT